MKKMKPRKHSWRHFGVIGMRTERHICRYCKCTKIDGLYTNVVGKVSTTVPECIKNKKINLRPIKI